MKELSESERLEGELLIRRLQAELRTEEMRLVLLKKIRQSQILAAAQQQQQMHPSPTIELKTGKYITIAITLKSINFNC